MHKKVVHIEKLVVCILLGQAYLFLYCVAFFPFNKKWKLKMRKKYFRHKIVIVVCRWTFFDCNCKGSGNCNGSGECNCNCNCVCECYAYRSHSICRNLRSDVEAGQVR